MTHRRDWLAGTVAALALAGLTAAAGAEEAPAECGADPQRVAGVTTGVLFRLDGTGYGDADLSTALQQALYDARVQHFQKLSDVADVAVLEVELARRAEASGTSPREVAREVFAIAPPDDAVVERFYRANEARIGRPLEAVREEIRQMMMQRAVNVRQNEIVEQVKRERGFELAYAAPPAPYAEIATDGFPSKGASDAKVTVIEFADYQCPHCQRTAAVLKQVAERYPEQVRVVFIDFPVNPSGISRMVAEGAACADSLGSFWRFHDLAFARQRRLGPDSSAQLAAEMGLDADAYRACMESTLPRERVARGEGEARRLGLSATPSVFLNGRRLHLRDVERELPRAIDEALAEKQDG